MANVTEVQLRGASTNFTIEELTHVSGNADAWFSFRTQPSCSTMCSIEKEHISLCVCFSYGFDSRV